MEIDHPGGGGGGGGEGGRGDGHDGAEKEYRGMEAAAVNVIHLRWTLAI